MFVHNEYTLKIFEEFSTGTGNVFIQARAGTGKTTSLIEMLNHFYTNIHLYPAEMQNARVCFVAFSNEVKKDLDKRVPPGERVPYEKEVHSVLLKLQKSQYLDKVKDSDYTRAIEVLTEYRDANNKRKGEVVELLDEVVKALNIKDIDEAILCSELAMEDMSDIHVKTFHGLGYGILRSVFEKAGNKIVLDEDKYHKIVKDFIKPKVSSMNYIEVLAAMKNLVNYTRLSFVDPKDDHTVRMLAVQYDIDLDKKRPDLMQSVIRWLPEVMEIGEDDARNKGIIDYTDMVYLPVKWELKSANPYKLMFVDEAQDLSKITRKLVYEQAMDPAGRAFFIGDTAQCVIDGTIIGGRKAEDIKDGDLIPSGFGRGKIVNSKVIKAYHRQVVDQKMITINTLSGKSLTTTPHHMHFSGYVSEFGKEYFYTYLMYRKNVGFRIGVSRKKAEKKTNTGNSTVGFKNRLSMETADKLWLLGAFETENDSRYNEAYYAFKYGIPTVSFNTRKKTPLKAGMMLDQERIDKLYSSLPTEENAKKLMDDLGLFYDRPHHTSKGSSKSDRKNFSIIMCGDPRGAHVLHRCELSIKSVEDVALLESIGLKLTDNGKHNGWRLRFYTQELSEIYDLLTKIRTVMDVNVIESAYLANGISLPFTPASHILPGMAIFVEQNGNLIRDEVVKVSTSLYTGGLHDFDVDKYHNYIANGIASHNSIFGFAGSDINSVRETISMAKAKELPLDICYRCPTSHIRLAQKVVPQIKAHPEAKPGVIVCADEDILTNILEVGDMVLCRVTAPLFQKAIECLKAKIPARIRGRDLCENLITVLHKIEKAADSTGRFRYEDLSTLIDDWAVEEIKYFMKREASDTAIQLIQDKRETLHICHKDIDAKDMEGLIAGIRSLIPSSKGDGRSVSAVEFSTIHRAKGLEANRIFILEPTKLPLVWDKQLDWQYQQEMNLLYVAITRSKDFLCILGSPNSWSRALIDIIPSHAYSFEDGKWVLRRAGEEKKKPVPIETAEAPKPKQALLF